MSAKSTGKKDGGKAYVAVTHSAGGYTYAAGDTKDKLFGNGAVTYRNKITSGLTTGTFTVTTKPVKAFFANGTLSGSAKATLIVKSGGATTGTGTFSLTKGTGGQSGHSFKGKFTLTGNSATGQYVYKYKGTSK